MKIIENTVVDIGLAVGVDKGSKENVQSKETLITMDSFTTVPNSVESFFELVASGA